MVERVGPSHDDHRRDHPSGAAMHLVQCDHTQSGGLDEPVCGTGSYTHVHTNDHSVTNANFYSHAY